MDDVLMGRMGRQARIDEDRKRWDGWREPLLFVHILGMSKFNERVEMISLQREK